MPPLYRFDAVVQRRQLLAGNHCSAAASQALIRFVTYFFRDRTSAMVAKWATARLSLAHSKNPAGSATSRPLCGRLYVSVPQWNTIRIASLA
jgi:hypothetical protein